MKKSILALASASFLCLFVQVNAQNPVMTFEVKNRISDENTPENGIVVSNLKKIELTLSFDPGEYSELPPFAKVTINPETPEGLSNWIEIVAISQPDRKVVDIKAEDHPIFGNHLTAGGVEVRELVLQILEPEEVVTRKIENYIGRLKEMVEEEYAKNPSEQLKRLADSYEQEVESLILGLRPYYMGNRIGVYNISITYHSNEESSWVGEIKKNISDVVVKDEGNSLEETLEKSRNPVNSIRED